MLCAHTGTSVVFFGFLTMTVLQIEALVLRTWKLGGEIQSTIFKLLKLNFVTIVNILFLCPSMKLSSVKSVRLALLLGVADDRHN
jgi:hypothetical protein